MEGTTKEDPTSLTLFGPIFNHISWVTSSCNIKTVDLPPKKVAIFLRHVKIGLGIST